MRPRRQFHGYSPPGKDSPRAIAQAVMFLTNARSIDHITVDGFARQYRLKPERAQGLLLSEQQRRAGG